jgi:hypothetical protein
MRVSAKSGAEVKREELGGAVASLGVGNCIKAHSQPPCCGGDRPRHRRFEYGSEIAVNFAGSCGVSLKRVHSQWFSQDRL